MFNFLKGRLIAVRLIMLAAMAGLIAVGIAAIYAAENPAESREAMSAADFGAHWQRQVVFAGLGAVAIVIVNAIGYRRFGPVSYWLYVAVLVLLGILLVDKIVDVPFVPVINFTRRWIKIGGLRVQPSELCKPAYILALAWYLRYRSNYRRVSALVGPFGLTMLAIILILLEPDLGTALLMIPILFTMLFAAGAKVKHLAMIVLFAGLVSPVLWFNMQDYQRMRISSVLLQNNWVLQKAEQNQLLGRILIGRDAATRIKNWKRDDGWQLMHSKYAIASGGEGGYGFRKGPYVKYNFLPDRHNDFIFSLIGHQWGFAGCVGVLALYVIIIICGLEIAGHNTDPFGRLAAVGIIAMLAVEVIVNVGMTLGLMPITGLTLPFVSYGGSSLIVSMAAVGLLNNIGRFRPFSVATRSLDRR